LSDLAIDSGQVGFEVAGRGDLQVPSVIADADRARGEMAFERMQSGTDDMW